MNYLSINWLRCIDYPDGEQTVLTSEILGLLKWCWRYYKHAPGEVVFNALPPMLRKIGVTIPPAPLQYRLTAAGEARLLEPVGRIRAQISLLEKIREGALTEPQLRLSRQPGGKPWHDCLNSNGCNLKLSNRPG